MRVGVPGPSWLAGCLGFLFSFSAAAAEFFHVATYNLDNYVMEATETRLPKSAAAKAKICESLQAAHAEVLALQEVGSPEALLDLQQRLEKAGVRYPYSELVAGADTNSHQAILSQFPILARRPHTNDSFLLFGRRFNVSRGFGEVDIQVSPDYTFTLLTVHLKSRRLTPQADEADWREQEALLLRAILTERLKANPQLNLLVVGDFNDTKDSKPLRAILGRGRTGLVDTRPVERPYPQAQHPLPIPTPAGRTVTWTYFFEKQDTYSRIDYILLSQAMAKDWVEAETYVLALPGWGHASDHRPAVAGFRRN